MKEEKGSLMKRRFLSILLACAMIVTLLPAVSYAETGEAGAGTDAGQTAAANTEKAIRFNTDGIAGYNNRKYHYIYYGKWKGNPIKWLVLDDKTNTGEDGFFLLSEGLIDVLQKFDDKSTKWQGSSAQKWCEDFAGVSGNSVPDAFTSVERDAILETVKSDDTYTYFDPRLPIIFEAYENILNGDKVFYLSAEEAESSKYGKPIDSTFDYGWFLRSYINATFAAYCPDRGSIIDMIYPGNSEHPRPAFNLGKSEIVFASSADGGKTDAATDSNLTAVGDWSGDTWKLTLRDSSRSFRASADKANAKPGETISINYSGAKTGDNEYVSAIIMDRNDELLYYGRIAQNSADGTAQIAVPKDLEPGRYVLRVFSEQYNGECNTDYVSEFVNLSFSISGGIDESVTNQISGYNDACGYDYIYYGSYEGSPIKWRVLDHQTNAGELGYFLLSEELLGSERYDGVYFSDKNIYDWQGSYAQNWCGKFAENSFTEDEKKYVMTVSKKEAREYNEGGIIAYMESELINEKVFFLSAYEARNPRYGFTGDEMRAAKWKGNAKEWWLRSYFALRGMGCIGANGQMTFDNNITHNKPARPAFNLDGSGILFLSNAKGGKADTETDPDLAAIPEHGSGEWKLTIYDRTRTNFRAETRGYTDVAAGKDIRVGYSGARKGSNEYVSVIIADAQGQNLYYGRIAEDSESGEAAVAVPYSLPVGKYTLKVYSEQYNGDYRTDYASNFVELPISVTGKDTEGPLARIESVKRISTTEAEVTFRSNEPGTYSYNLVESGKGFQDGKFGYGHGMIPNRKAQTIIVGGLRPREGCDIYFAVVDQSDNQRPSKVMASIPADVIHKVTLHAGNGAVIAEGKDVTQYAEGESVILPTAGDMSRSGGVFKGWYTDCDFSGAPVTKISDTDSGDKVFYAKWEWDGQEQFSLSPGTTYYFDLSGAGIPGTVNGGNAAGAVSVPDQSLHYVPFTYVGTIDAYSFSTEMKTTDESAVGNQYLHSLFVSDYNVVHSTGWSNIDKVGYIFGKSYTSGNISYTMRALSGGNRYTRGGTEAIGPRNNEWDIILDKNEGYIKNADMFSWVQDEYEDGGILTNRMLRGYSINGYTVRTAGSSFEGNIQEHYGFRPALELPNVETLGTDGLKAVTLDLNGGSVNGRSDENIQIVVKKGESFTAPAAEGLVSDTGYLYNWLGSDGKTYQPGDSVPAEITSLTAQWGSLSGEIKIGTHKWNRLLTDVNYDLFFKAGESVEITASDKSSGNVTIYYLASDKTLTESELKQMLFIQYPGKLQIGDPYLDRDGRYIIYARLSDASGNVRYISSDGIVVDHTAPVISGITDGKIYCEAQIVSVEEANLYNITVNGNPVTLTDGKCTLDPADGEQNVVVTDKAGNTASVTVTVNDGHTPLADDNDCTTPVLCRYCNAVITAAKQHDFTGALKSDETGHWHQCRNEGCSIESSKAVHTWQNDVCEVCGYQRMASGGSSGGGSSSGGGGITPAPGAAPTPSDPDADVITVKEDMKNGSASKPGAETGMTTTTTTKTTVKTTTTEMTKNEQGQDISKTTASVSKDLGDKLLDQAVTNKSDRIEIAVKSSDANNSGSAGTGAADSVKSTEVELPKATVNAIAKDTNADLVIKTDNGEVVLDNKTLETIAGAAKGDTVTIVVGENTQLKETQKPAEKIVGKNGTLFDLAAKIGEKLLHQFEGGKAHVTLPMPEKLKGKDVLVIYIDDNGLCKILNHSVAKIGAEDYIRFTTTHFSTFAVVDKDEAERPIKEQNDAHVKELMQSAKFKVTTTKTSKKSVKVQVTAKSSKTMISDIKSLGYTVKYQFYRSTKKNAGYKVIKTKAANTFTNTKGTKGTKYYYKARVLVYDGKTLVARSGLRQCSWGSRTWTK